MRRSRREPAAGATTKACAGRPSVRAAIESLIAPGAQLSSMTTRMRCAPAGRCSAGSGASGAALAAFYQAASERSSGVPEYRLKASAEADRLESTAAAESQHAKDANQRADDYMLAVVLFASSLFFAGISIK